MSKKIILGVIAIVILLFIVKISAGVYIINEQEKCTANGCIWNKTEVVCTCDTTKVEN